MAGLPLPGAGTFRFQSSAKRWDTIQKRPRASISPRWMLQPLIRQTDRYSRLCNGYYRTGTSSGLIRTTNRTGKRLHHGHVQVLVCVSGRGWYVEEGKDPVNMTPGTVVAIPEEARHWHGAAADSCSFARSDAGPDSRSFLSDGFGTGRPAYFQLGCRPFAIVAGGLVLVLLFYDLTGITLW